MFLNSWRLCCVDRCKIRKTSQSDNEIQLHGDYLSEEKNCTSITPQEPATSSSSSRSLFSAKQERENSTRLIELHSSPTEEGDKDAPSFTHLNVPLCSGGRPSPTWRKSFRLFNTDVRSYIQHNTLTPSPFLVRTLNGPPTTASSLSSHRSKKLAISDQSNDINVWLPNARMVRQLERLKHDTNMDLLHDYGMSYSPQTCQTNDTHRYSQKLNHFEKFAFPAMSPQLSPYFAEHVKHQVRCCSSQLTSQVHLASPALSKEFASSNRRRIIFRKDFTAPHVKNHIQITPPSSASSPSTSGFLRPDASEEDPPKAFRKLSSGVKSPKHQLMSNRYNGCEAQTLSHKNMGKNMLQPTMHISKVREAPSPMSIKTFVPRRTHVAENSSKVKTHFACSCSVPVEGVTSRRSGTRLIDRKNRSKPIGQSDPTAMNQKVSEARSHHGRNRGAGYERLTKRKSIPSPTVQSEDQDDAIFCSLQGKVIGRFNAWDNSATQYLQKTRRSAKSVSGSAWTKSVDKFSAHRLLQTLGSPYNHTQTKVYTEDTAMSFVSTSTECYSGNDDGNSWVPSEIPYVQQHMNNFSAKNARAVCNLPSSWKFIPRRLHSSASLWILVGSSIRRRVLSDTPDQFSVTKD